ncbi:BglG family transcription antiterminator [Listeria kieliensis]
MKLDQRCILILDFLLTQDNFIKIKDIADSLTISERTIRYSLDKIDTFLNENRIQKLTRHSKKGIIIENRSAIGEILAKFKRQITPEKYKYAANEIEQFILLKLLLSEKDIAIHEFEQTLFISRSSVLNYLRAIEGEIFLSDLTLSHKPRIGYSISGDVLTKCTLFARKFLKAINIREFYQFLESEQTLSKKGELFFYNLFELDFLQQAAQETEMLLAELKRTVDDQLYLTILTVLLKIHLKQPNFSYANWQNQGSEYDSALSSMISVVENAESARNSKEAIQFSYELCKAMGAIYHLDFCSEEAPFFTQITSHIGLMIHRIKAGITTHNPIFSDFMRDNKELFLATKKACEQLEKQFSFVVSAQEVSFLAIYFASELKRRQTETHLRPSLLIVCAEGIAVSNMLKVQLDQLFEFSTIDTLPLRKFKANLLDTFDYVITTVKIQDIHSERILRIGNYLQKSDMQLLQKHFQMKLLKKKSQVLDKFSEIMAIIGEHTQITNLSKLEIDLLNLLAREDSKRKEPLPEIEFDASLVVQKNAVTTWKQAISLGTEALLKKGFIEQRYHDKIMRNFKEYGPYMVVAPGVVLAHAGLQDGALANAMSVTVLENGVLFFDRYEKPVQLLFTLAFHQKEAHKVVEQLVKIALNEEKVAQIISTRSARDICSYLKAAIYE